MHLARVFTLRSLCNLLMSVFSLESLHVEDCSSLTDDGLLRLAGLRLHSLTLCNAKHVSTAALLRFLQLSDLSMLRDLNLSGCLALTDRVLRLLAQR